MERKFTPEEKAEQALESLDGLFRAEAPAGLEEKLFAKLAARSVAKMPKWAWAAAVVVLAVNIAALVKFTGNSKKDQSDLREVATYYFPGGNDWYSQSN